MNPADIDPETTWQTRSDGRGYFGWGDGYTVAVDDNGFTLTIGPSDYERRDMQSLAESVTEARDIRRIVMGQPTPTETP